METRSGNHRGIDIVGIGVAYVWNIYACEIDEHSNENHNPHKTLLVFEKTKQPTLSRRLLSVRAGLFVGTHLLLHGGLHRVSMTTRTNSGDPRM
jgi:hypothetical protein